MTESTPPKSNANAHPPTTDVEQLLDDLDAGLVKRALALAISQAAGGAIENSEKGEVTLKLVFMPIEGTSQVHCEHTLKFLRPTTDGNQTESITRKTTLHVGAGGVVSLLQPRIDMFGQMSIAR